MSTTLAGLLQLGFLLLLLAIVYVPLGDYMARVFRSTHDTKLESLVYRAIRVDPRRGQSWGGYALAVVAFSFVSIFLLYFIQRIQSVLPWAAGKPNVSPSMAFNTAISFVTNTNWQSYSPEAVMSNTTQMIGLTVQNFTSAAVGLAVAVALLRGLINRRGDGAIGNFWVDLVRGVVRILLPLSVIVALLLIFQGAIQSWSTSMHFTSLGGQNQQIPLGPFASQEAIKELGTNGGGTYNANSAHPFSNPTPLSNLIEIFALMVIPVALTRTYGTLVADRRQGLTILGVMAAIWGAMLAIVWYFESRTNGVAASAAGSMMEGKELRFGIPASAVWSVATTGTSTGAVNSAHDSFSAGGGGALIWNMLLGEVAPGGVGTGLYSILILALITAFVGGLLVGRSPEFLGKRIGQHEITMAALYVLTMPALVLTGVAITAILGSTTSFQGNSGNPGTPDSIHGFSEVLYAFASAANNNGSAFAGITVTSDWFQTSLGFAMLFGRILPIIFTLAIAGLFARQRPRQAGAEVVAAAAPTPAGVLAASAGLSGGVAASDGETVNDAGRSLTRAPDSTAVLPTHGLLFGTLLLGTTLLVAGLTFFPTMALGPIAEALL